MEPDSGVLPGRQTALMLHTTGDQASTSWTETEQSSTPGADLPIPPFALPGLHRLTLSLLPEAELVLWTPILASRQQFCQRAPMGRAGHLGLGRSRGLLTV